MFTRAVARRIYTDREFSKCRWGAPSMPRTRRLVQELSVPDEKSSVFGLRFRSGGRPHRIENRPKRPPEQEDGGDGYRVVNLRMNVVTHDLKTRGLSISAIARRTGLNRSSRISGWRVHTTDRASHVAASVIFRTCRLRYPGGPGSRFCHANEEIPRFREVPELVCLLGGLEP